jgi:Peptidase family M1 domain
MLDYAWRLVKTRGSLWVPVVGCALLAAVPGTLIAIFFVVPVTVLLLSGDPVLALDLAPRPFDSPGVAAIATFATFAGGLALWARLYAAAVWASDDRNDSGVLSAFRATRTRWLDVLVLYALVYVILIAIGAVAAGLVTLSGDTSAALAAGLVGGTIIFVGRVVLRVVLTLAVRSAVLDGTRPRSAWAKAVEVGRNRRRDAVAAWVALLAAGVAIWIGGRLIAPVLQDTALDFPAGSAYVAYREIAQLALAIPLEALLLALSLGVWTALYLGRDGRSSGAVGTDRSQRGADPWIIRALGGLVILTIFANGVPTILEDRLNAALEGSEGAIRASEIDPADALRPAPALRTTDGTTYQVTALIEDDRLTWTTRVRYRNQSDEFLRNLGLHVYPAAYARDLEDIPLATEMLRADVGGYFRSSARPGTFAVQEILVNGNRARFSRDETELLVNLPRTLAPDDRVAVKLTTSARLPRFAERFGRWGHTVLLGNWIPVVATRLRGEWDFDRFPSTGDPFASDVANYRVAIEADESLSVVGAGVLQSIEQTTTDTKTWHFTAANARDAAFVASPFMRGLETTVGSLTVRSWYPASRARDGRVQLDVAAAAAADYQQRFGPLPFDEIDVVATPGFLGGMEFPGVVFIGDLSAGLRGVPLLPELYSHATLLRAGTRYMIAHEIAHQWWYASVGNDQQREPWLDEAFAEVSTRLWLESIEGDDRTWKMAYMTSDASPGRVVGRSVTDFDSNDAYADAIYLAGAEVLLELRAHVGPDDFDRLLALWHERNRLRVASIDEFIATVEEESGREAADIIRKYR